MTEHIEKGALMAHIVEERRKWGEDYDCEQILGDIEDFPIADVRPAVRGEWSVAIGYDPKRSFLCSVCQRMNYEPSNYCPNCAADMRGDPNA